MAFTTDMLLLSAFVLRILGLSSTGDQEDAYRLRSFQILSCVAPFIWYVFFRSPYFSFAEFDIVG